MPGSKLNSRRGHTLVLFVLLLAALLAMAALVIDVGFARLAQRQMQTATDAAALEGARFQNQIPQQILEDARLDSDCPCDELEQDSPAELDCIRRWLASRTVAYVFDDDMDLVSDAPQLGAGPIINFSGGAGPQELAASQQISIPQSPVYKPQRSPAGQDADVGDSNPQDYGLELNLDNQAHGDLLESGDAFIARMQRIHSDLGSSEEGIQSRGPELPLLFGRGSLIASGENGNSYSPRQHGFTVRSQSTAAAMSQEGVPTGQVLTVGPAIPHLNVRGAAPFALDQAFFKSPTSPLTVDPDNGRILSQDEPVGRFINTGNLPSQIDPDATAFSVALTTIGLAAGDYILINAEVIRITDIEVGEFDGQWDLTVERAQMDSAAQAHDENTAVFAMKMISVGDEVPLNNSAQPQLLQGSATMAYVPVYAAIEGVPRIIGFGMVTWSYASETNVLTITKTPARDGAWLVAEMNATAVAKGVAISSSDQWQQLDAAKRSFSDFDMDGSIDDDVLLAPVLIR